MALDTDVIQGSKAPLATRDEIMRRGSMAAPGSVHALYDEAFRDFGLRALWSCKQHPHPRVGDAAAITETLRVEGGVAGRRLAERILTECRAAL